MTFLGWTYHFQGRVDEAIDECKKGHRSGSDLRESVQRYRRLLIERGEHEELHLPEQRSPARATRLSLPLDNLAAFAWPRALHEGAHRFEKSLEIGPATHSPPKLFRNQITAAIAGKNPWMKRNCEHWNRCEGGVDVDAALARLATCRSRIWDSPRSTPPRSPPRHAGGDFRVGKTPDRSPSPNASKHAKTCSSPAPTGHRRLCPTRIPPLNTSRRAPSAYGTTGHGSARSRSSPPAPATSPSPRSQITAEVMGNQVEAIHDVGSPASIGLRIAASGSPKPRHRGLRRNGRLCPAWWVVWCPARDRCAHQRGYGASFQTGRAARHAQQLRQQRHRCQY